MEARVALEAILDRLRNVRLPTAELPGVFGLAFRSPRRLPVVFDN